MYNPIENDHLSVFGAYRPKSLTDGAVPDVDLGVVVIAPGEHHPCMCMHPRKSLGRGRVRNVRVNGELVVLKQGEFMI